MNISLTDFNDVTEPSIIGGNIVENSRKAEIAILRKSADLARDNHHWSKAANLYRKVLQLDPEASPIWVQYGHMLKESGDLSEARNAYESALRLDPNNADTCLQLGHLLKISKKKFSAIEMYVKALELDPQLRDAERELRQLGAEKQLLKINGHSAPASGKVYFDISDLIHYFKLNRAPSGIQRVVAGLVGASSRFEEHSIGICALDEEAAVWKTVDSSELCELLGLSRIGSDPSDPAWVAKVNDIRRSIAAAAPLMFAEGSVVVAPGAPWGVPGYFAAVREAKRLTGVRYVPFIHDLVPILFPEYCEIVRPEDFGRWISNMIASADLIIANSDSTRADFQRLLTRFSLATIRCEVVQPNGNLRELHDADQMAEPSIPGLPERFVLCVGTIEPRKNHLLLFRAWRRLIRELGAANVPTLVVVGRYGWSCENTREFLTKTAFVEGKVVVLNDVRDELLPSLYKRAEFTIYNSHYEGWGLPVTESLCFGKVPLAPRNSALIESGGTSAIFFDTDSEPSLVATVRDVLLNPDKLRHLEASIAITQICRSWLDIVAQVHGLATSLATSNADDQAAFPGLELGQVYAAGHRSDRFVDDVNAIGNLDEVKRSHVGESFRRRSEWHAVEEWGVWSRSKTFDISLTIPACGADGLKSCSPETLIIYLHILGHREICDAFWEVDGIRVLSLSIKENEEKLLRFSFDRDPSRTTSMVVRCVQGGLCNLEKHDATDKRVVGVGLRSLMVCQEHDMSSRMRMMEFAAGFIMTNVTRRCITPPAS